MDLGLQEEATAPLVHVLHVLLLKRLQLAQEDVGVFQRHEQRGPVLDRHDLVELQLQVHRPLAAAIGEGESPFVGRVPTLLVVLGLVLQRDGEHLVPLLLLPGHVVAQGRVRAHRRDEGAAPHLLVDLHRLPEGDGRLPPIHAGLGVGCASGVHHQTERRELLGHRGHAVRDPQRLLDVAADRAEVGPEADEEDAAREALLGPRQPSVGLREGLVGAGLPEERPHIDLVANEDHDREGRQEAVLLPTCAQVADRCVAIAFHAGAP
mmetsp:Transcript_107891/g.302142  ORF Transcript_107891/g.302142 Transcript_107891/m.302142 type:complete len:265 (+) Transcript_107891:669-1463(+)